MTDTSAASLAGLIAWTGNLCAEAIDCASGDTDDNAKVLLAVSLREVAAALRGIAPLAGVIDATWDEAAAATWERAEAAIERAKGSGRAELLAKLGARERATAELRRPGLIAI